ncbi:DUF6463 family protein [Spirillospora sp. NPDC048824]|uniref:DUF6463 family protein n=1 Tax=Spirillospora sp. NPDC048824 TaxID=3364526 RepID=UPI00370FB87E
MTASAPRDVTGVGRWVPRLILIVAVLHLIFGVVVDGSLWRGMVSDGVWNSATGDKPRMSAEWFMVSGIAFFGLGLLTRKAVLVTGRIPVETGWILLALGIPITVLEPVGGAPALIGIGVLALIASRHDIDAPPAGHASARSEAAATSSSAAASD